MNLQGLVKDKRLLAVAGAGAVLGLVTLMRRKTGTPAAGSSGSGAVTSTTGSSYTPGSLGSYDSSGTDAYNNINTEVNNRLDAFGTTLSGVQSQLSGLTPSGTSQSGSATTSTPASMPTTTNPGYIKIAKGGSWATVSKSTGKSVAQLRALNPGVTGAFSVGEQIRVR